MTRVLFRGKWYAGELLYSYDFPWKRANEKGEIVDTLRRPQRVGLLIDDVIVHFTVPTEVKTSTK